ncbi:hypothetical protein SAMN02745146_0079 [Hymenobacter daecheongensis DSM 21074]|uniref:Uncharacterized protein n=1 Tax=Hymenobacter daecheongensis DSM 21074 TaxID=1121955 RepID=A0A1M6LW78_9BACT|nr:hypothetical protein [Hymenobacter daecheongensis]SHJ75467.1 hypothetical protein SAMN02745146_0079 [Hymenobacter daecheongensis DSM 21074]
MKTVREQTAVVRQVLQREEAAGHAHEADCLRSVLITLARHEAPQSQPAAELPEGLSLYKQFEAQYRIFHQRETGLTAKMDGSEGKALKAIIEYLKQNSRAGNDAGALAGWSYVLDNWEHLTDFLKQQTSLKAINKYLAEIIGLIKKANTKLVPIKPDPAVARKRQRLLSDLDEARNTLAFLTNLEPYANQAAHISGAKQRVTDIETELNQLA